MTPITKAEKKDYDHRRYLTRKAKRLTKVESRKARARDRAKKSYYNKRRTMSNFETPNHPIAATATGAKLSDDSHETLMKNSKLAAWKVAKQDIVLKMLQVSAEQADQQKQRAHQERLLELKQDQQRLDIISAITRGDDIRQAMELNSRASTAKRKARGQWSQESQEVDDLTRLVAVESTWDSRVPMDLTALKNAKSPVEVSLKPQSKAPPKNPPKNPPEAAAEFHFQPSSTKLVDSLFWSTTGREIAELVDEFAAQAEQGIQLLGTDPQVQKGIPRFLQELAAIDTSKVSGIEYDQLVATIKKIQGDVEKALASIPQN